MTLRAGPARTGGGRVHGWTPASDHSTCQVGDEKNCLTFLGIETTNPLQLLAGDQRTSPPNSSGGPPNKHGAAGWLFYLGAHQL